MQGVLSPPDSPSFCKGGKEAIELARSNVPDSCCLTLMMPEVTGFGGVRGLA